jgi:transposase
MEGMPSRRALLETIERLVAENERLRAEVDRLLGRVGDLEAELARVKGETEKPRPPSWVKPNVPDRPAAEKPERKKRAGKFVRKRSDQPTQRIVHAVAECPQCHCHLVGGWVKRHRETIEIPLPQVDITDHVLLERVCPQCATVCVPHLGPSDGVVGKHRLGPRLMSLIGTLHEVGRMPIEVIQTHLQTLYQLKLSVGAIDGVLKTLSTKGKKVVEALQAEIQQSSVVHADETGWREDGKNRYAWLIATPHACYLEVGRRNNPQIDQILGKDFAGTLVTDFYGAYDHFLGPKQRCWAHLWRDVKDLLAQFPQDQSLIRWAHQLRRLYRQARDAPPLPDAERTKRRLRLEQLLRTRCEPVAGKDAPHRTLAQRILKHSHELFTFVENPAVPHTNNFAERLLRPYVIARKVWGGTRSAQGSTDAMRRASLVLTWRLRGLNPFSEFHNLLLAPHS